MIRHLSQNSIAEILFNLGLSLGVLLVSLSLAIVSVLVNLVAEGVLGGRGTEGIVRLDDINVR